MHFCNSTFIGFSLSIFLQAVAILQRTRFNIQTAVHKPTRAFKFTLEQRRLFTALLLVAFLPPET